MRSAVTVRRRSEVANVKSRLKNMRDDDDVGEDGSMSADENLEEVQRKLLEIQRRKRGRVRWTISRHTAEMALDALGVTERPKAEPQNSKSRRRKRTKRLL